MALGMAVFAALFSVVNPLGAVPVFLALTPQNSAKERRQIARHTSLFVALILISFFLAGSLILSFFGISNSDRNSSETSPSLSQKAIAQNSQKTGRVVFSGRSPRNFIGVSTRYLRIAFRLNQT